MVCRLTLAALALGLAASSASAAVVTWNTGVTGDWGTGTNWDSNSVPAINGGTPDTVNIDNGAVTYSGTSGDWADNTTVTVTGSSASWIQSSNNWLKIGDGTGNVGSLTVASGASFDVSAAGTAFVGNSGAGTLLVDGGTFKAQTININPGTGAFPASTLTLQNGGTVNSTAIAVNDNGTFTLTAGSVTTGNVHVNGTGHLTITSGIVTNTGEFHPGGPGHMAVLNGGTLSNAIVSFDGSTSAALDLNAGILISSNGTYWDGVYSTGGYVNFTPGSTAVFDLTGGASSTNANALLSSGRVRYDNTTDLAAFTVTSIAGGVEIALAPVPEPASLALLALGGLTLLRRRKA